MVNNPFIRPPISWVGWHWGGVPFGSDDSERHGNWNLGKKMRTHTDHLEKGPTSCTCLMLFLMFPDFRSISQFYSMTLFVIGVRKDMQAGAPLKCTFWIVVFLLRHVPGMVFPWWVSSWVGTLGQWLRHKKTEIFGTLGMIWKPWPRCCKVGLVGTIPKEMDIRFGYKKPTRTKLQSCLTGEMGKFWALGWLKCITTLLWK